MPRNLSIRVIITSFGVGFVPIAILWGSTFLWGVLFGGYNETFKIGAFIFSLITIIGTPFSTGYSAARSATEFQYMHGMISILFVFIAAIFFTSLHITIGSAIALLASILPETMLFVIPESVLLGYFDGTFLLFILFCSFGAIGVFVFQKSHKSSETLRQTS